jgi:hypothetical protein
VAQGEGPEFKPKYCKKIFISLINSIIMCIQKTITPHHQKKKIKGMLLHALLTFKKLSHGEYYSVIKKNEILSFAGK